MKSDLGETFEIKIQEYETRLNNTAREMEGVNMEVIKNEFISKLEVVRILQKAYAEGRIKAEDGCVSLLDDINAMPSADVQPVKHGQWSECYTDTHHYSGICSVCGKASIKSLTESLYAFCPKCGAKMDGDTE